jgi:hypothetical protein
MVFQVPASAAGVSFSETVHATDAGPAQLTRSARTLIVDC